MMMSWVISLMNEWMNEWKDDDDDDDDEDGLITGYKGCGSARRYIRGYLREAC